MGVTRPIPAAERAAIADRHGVAPDLVPEAVIVLAPVAANMFAEPTPRQRVTAWYANKDRAKRLREADDRVKAKPAPLPLPAAIHLTWSDE